MSEYPIPSNISNNITGIKLFAANDLGYNMGTEIIFVTKSSTDTPGKSSYMYYMLYNLCFISYNQ